MVTALIAVLTALISINGAVAALVPVVVVVALRAGFAPSRRLMPLAFAGSAGSLLALTGSPVNIVVSDAAAEASARPFAFFEFALAGLPVLAGTVAIILLLGDRLLPERTPSAIPSDLSVRVQLLRQYQLPDASELVPGRPGFQRGRAGTGFAADRKHLFAGMSTPSGDLVVLGVQRAGRPLSASDAVLQAGDALLLSGSWQHLVRDTADPELLVVNDPALLRRSLPLGTGAKRALVVLAGLVVVLATGLMPLSTAFIGTGAADLIAGYLLNVVGGSSPQLALLAMCVVTGRLAVLT